ncbi:hypothetical protein KP509_07G027200 [Ceratopteris richardii]|uniref:RCD1 WWE domain-containing protein n=1 Tax=Ceratopteris richardii TaxID=49495 RepID=A0A8T2U8G7_CERRI|nr:hypothetical protein KP509_07G027200 [Ceratopteris richardii]
MQLDAFHSPACRKRKMDCGSQAWPCKLSNCNLWKPNTHIVDENSIPVCFLYMKKGRWTAYTHEINAPLSLSFAENQTSARFLLSQQSHAVHFVHMMQLNLQTGYVCSIAWIDGTGKLVMPATLFEGPSRLWLSILKNKSQKVLFASSTDNLAASEQPP